MEEECRLTTIDNPFSPFDEFEDWQTFDEVEKQYYTLNYLATIATMFMNSLDLDKETAFALAKDEIVRLNVLGVHMKITKKQADFLMNSRNKSNKI